MPLSQNSNLSNHSYNAIPKELQQLPQWVCWKYEGEGDERTKVPYQPNGLHASVKNHHTWCSFEEAVAAFQAYPQRFDGIGFVFKRGGKYAGIDLDATTDEAILARQKFIFEKFDSYAEISPSGLGLHIIIKAHVLSGKRRDKVELYSADRFFCMTGNVYHNAPIAERQELAEILWAELGKGKNDQPAYAGDLNEKYTDDEIISCALNAANGEKFKLLFEGRWREVLK
jgi:primase-polymerase (primpol)-like protein